LPPRQEKKVAAVGQELRFAMTVFPLRGIEARERYSLAAGCRHFEDWLIRVRREDDDAAAAPASALTLWGVEDS